MPTLVIRLPDGTEQEQEVGQQLLVGRSDENDLILSEGGVSRKHARFFLEGEALHVEDVGSANGTWVDGERIEGAVEVGPKNQVVIGDYEIALKLGSKKRPAVVKGKGNVEPTAGMGKPVTERPRATKVMPSMKPGDGAALAKRPKPAGNVTVPTLRGLNGAIQGKAFPLKGTMAVGRVLENDLRIEDDSVSRRHAELEVQGREVIVRDLGSANGTSVNGAPISEDTTLAPGDIVSFGVVELMFEAPGSAGKAAPMRPSRPGGDRGSRPLPRRGGAQEPDVSLLETAEKEKPGMPPARKRLMIIGGSVLGLLFVLVLVKALTAPVVPVDPGGVKPLAGGAGGKAPLPEKDPAAEIEELLACARSYSSPEIGEPDWDRAKKCVDRILELEPIHDEGNKLAKKIEVHRGCQAALAKAKESMSLGRMEEALDWYGRVKPECPSYFLKALSEAKDPLEQIKKRVGAECKTYASNGKWEQALDRCELYARYACQTMKPEELYPPAGMSMKLDGPMRKTDWRPTDPLYANFLRARAKIHPELPIWQCVEIPVLRPPPPPPDPNKLAKDEFARRYPDPGMATAMQLYFDGKFNEAPVHLQKIIENIGKAQYHSATKQLLQDIQNVTNLYQTGVTELGQDKPERAEEPFRKALALDEQLVLGPDKLKLPSDEKKRELERRTSFVRRSITDDMARSCYNKGKDKADRKDTRAACAIWKLGYSFSKGNNDLLKAVTNVCTARANQLLSAAGSCESYKDVLNYAVDGDGIKDQVEKGMAELGCN